MSRSSDLCSALRDTHFGFGGVELLDGSAGEHLVGALRLVDALPEGLALELELLVLLEAELEDLLRDRVNLLAVRVEQVLHAGHLVDLAALDVVRVHRVEQLRAAEILDVRDLHAIEQSTLHSSCASDDTRQQTGVLTHAPCGGRAASCWPSPRSACARRRARRRRSRRSKSGSAL